MTEPACPTCKLPQIFCSHCKPDLEMQASQLWRRENPEMSVFACDIDMQNEYRRRVLEEK